MLKIRNKKGFTLMELLIVIAIIGLIAAIAAPKMGSTVDDAKRAKFIGNIAALKTSIELFKATNAGMIRNTTIGKKFNIDTAVETQLTDPIKTNFSLANSTLDSDPTITNNVEWATQITDAMLLANNKKISTGDTSEISSIQDFADVIETFQFTKIDGTKGAFAIAVDTNNKDYIIFTITPAATDGGTVVQNTTGADANTSDIVYSSKYNGYVKVFGANADNTRVYVTVEDFWNKYK